MRVISGTISGALQVATTRWRRIGQGKVARWSQRRRDNRGNATTSWQTRGKWEGRRTRGKREGRRQRTRGGGAPREQEAAAARREASRQTAGGASGASSSSSLAIRWEGGDQSVYLDSFVTEEAPEPENEKKQRSTQYRKCDFSLPVLEPLLEIWSANFQYW